jgi:OsmC-like protein
MTEAYRVVVGSGSFRRGEEGVWHLAHRWTPDGVSVEADFTGAHLVHLAVAGCVLNDLYREAARLSVRLDGVRVCAGGGFDGDWHSTGINYTVELDSSADPARLAELLTVVDEVAEIPRAVRGGAPVCRIG